MFMRLIILLLVASYGFVVYAGDTCQALISFRNDLWIADRTGNLIQRLTYDGTPKSHAVWSPTGQFLAYSPETPIGEEKSIVILENSGEERLKIIVEPKSNDWSVRFIDKLVWEKAGLLWSDANVGPNGGFIDVWHLHPDLINYRHEKRIEVLGDCTLSPNQRYAACILHNLPSDRLEINDTSKKEFPDGEDYFDKDPYKVNLGDSRLQSGPAWDSAGRRIAVVARTEHGRFLVVLNRIETDEGRSLWQLVKKSLPSGMEPIRTIRFHPTNGRIVLEGENQVYELDQEKEDSITSALVSLPERLKVDGAKQQPEELEVLDWRCP